MSQINIVKVSRSQHTQVPKWSHRPGQHKVASLRALGLLCLLLSHSDTYTTTTDDIARQWAEGRDAVRAAMDELKTAGYIVQRRVQGDRGRFSTITYLSPDPAELDHLRGEFPQVAPKTDFQASADQASVRPSSVDRSSVDQAVKEEETNKDTKKEEPPLPPAATASPEVDQHQGEGNSDTENPDDRLIALAIAARPRGSRPWTPGAVRKALDHPDVASRPRELVEAVLLAAAADPITTHPGRITADGYDGWHLAEEHRRITADVNRQRNQVPQWKLDLAARQPACTSSAARVAARKIARQALLAGHTG